jgi:hypothetical protein
MAAPSISNAASPNPSIQFQAVTAGTALTQACRALYVGGSGNVVVQGLDDGVNYTFTAVPTGAVLPIGVKLIVSAGTTATAIVALF